MKFILDILKGIVIGIANIIPGVSGGTMMVAMGIYDKLIHALTHIFKEFKKSVMVFLPILIGMGLGIVGLSRVIEVMFEKVPIQTNLLFIGLILGGIPVIWNRVKGSTIRLWHILGFLVFFALVVGLALLDGTVGAEADLTLNLINFLKLCGVGIIAAATMVVPGVSGSMMLMLLGYYEPVIRTINGLVDALAAGDGAGIMQGVGVLLPFGIGVVIGIVIVAKGIDILLSKFPCMVFWCIMGLIVGSPVAIVILNDFSDLRPVNILTGVVALAVGIVIAYFLGGDKLAKSKAEPAGESGNDKSDQEIK